MFTQELEKKLKKALGELGFKKKENQFIKPLNDNVYADIRCFISSYRKRYHRLVNINVGVMYKDLQELSINNMKNILLSFVSIFCLQALYAQKPEKLYLPPIATGFIYYLEDYYSDNIQSIVNLGINNDTIYFYQDSLIKTCYKKSGLDLGDKPEGWYDDFWIYKKLSPDTLLKIHSNYLHCRSKTRYTMTIFKEGLLSEIHYSCDSNFKRANSAINFQRDSSNRVKSYKLVDLEDRISSTYLPSMEHHEYHYDSVGELSRIQMFQTEHRGIHFQNTIQITAINGLITSRYSNCMNPLTDINAYFPAMDLYPPPLHNGFEA